MRSPIPRLFASLTVVIALLTASSTAALGQEPYALTILHAGETQAHIEPFTSDDVLVGGVARRMTAIQAVRAEGGNVLLVDAGDAFQGTLFFNQWQGEEEAYFMNALGYQAMAIGNHEFDSGPGTLGSFIRSASFPVIASSIDASAEPALDDEIEPYVILTIGGEQVGLTGLTTVETLTSSSPGSTVASEDVSTAAAEAIAAFEPQGGNEIVALTHIGYEVDQALAASVAGIDVIVGGHTHTLLGEMEGAEGPYPTVVTGPNGDPTLIVHGYQWGMYLGRLDVVFGAEGEVQSYSGQPILIDETFAEDGDIAAAVARHAQPLETLRATVIGSSSVVLDGAHENVCWQETNLANLICDAMLRETAAEGTQVCLVNGGGIRASIDAGEVTMGQVLEVLPFGNQIATATLSGADLLAALENGVSQYGEGGGRFAQVGGMRYAFDPAAPVGSRIVSAEVLGADGSYAAVDQAASYRIVTNDYMRQGGDGYTMLAENATDVYDSGAVLADAVAAYIQANSPLSPATDGRIAIGTAAATEEVAEAVATPAATAEAQLLPVSGATDSRPACLLLAGGALLACGVALRRLARAA